MKTEGRILSPFFLPDKMYDPTPAPRIITEPASVPQVDYQRISDLPALSTPTHILRALPPPTPVFVPFLMYDIFVQILTPDYKFKQNDKKETIDLCWFLIIW